MCHLVMLCSQYSEYGSIFDIIARLNKEYLFYGIIAEMGWLDMANLHKGLFWCEIITVGSISLGLYGFDYSNKEK